MLAQTDKTAPMSTFQYPPNAKYSPDAKLTPRVNRLTMFGVIGNLMSWRLMGMETFRFIRAKIPSVGLTSQRSSFFSAERRSCSLATFCQLSCGTALQYTTVGPNLAA